MRIEFGELKIGKVARTHLWDCIFSNWASGGPKVKDFETQWGALFGYNHNKAMSSGTDACINSCCALYDFGAKRGDEIIVPALSFIATSNAVLAAGFTPVFVDIDRETLNIDERKIEEKITSKTRAIMCVHTMGKPCDIDTIKDICNRRNLFMIEDACLPPGEFIQTSEGIKVVENVKKGDLVLTHAGRWKPVVRTMVNQYDRKLYNIKAYGVWDTLKVTDNHPVFVCRTKDIQKNQEWQSDQPVRADQIKVGDYLVLPRYTKVEDCQVYDLTKYDHTCSNSKWRSVYEKRKMMSISVNDHLMTIAGWYLAEGWVYKQHVEFALSCAETDNLKKLTDALQIFGFDFKVKNQFPVMRVCVFHKQLACFLQDNFGSGAANKKIPQWVVDLPCDKLEALLFAYVAGDGNEIKNRKDNFAVTSVSLDLLITIKRICSKLGYYAGVTKTAKAGSSLLLGRQVEVRDKYQLRFSKYRKNPHDRRVFVTDKYIYYRVRDVKSQDYVGPVYNFEVEDDHTYCTLGYAVHNCEAHGAKYKDRFIGTDCDMACFSFYVAHLICCGEGGMVSTMRQDIADVLNSTRTHGRKNGDLYFDHERFGLNSKMNDLEASLGLEAVAHDVFWKVYHTRKANLYYMIGGMRNKKVHEHVFFNKEEEHEDCCPHALSMVMKDPVRHPVKELYAYLEDNSIKCKRNFGCIPTQQKSFAWMGHQLGEFPESEYVGDNGLHFGCHQFLKTEDLDYVIDKVCEWFKQKG